MHKLKFFFFHKNGNNLRKFLKSYISTKPHKRFSSSVFGKRLELKSNEEEINCFNKILYSEFLIKVKQNITIDSEPICLKYLLDEKNEEDGPAHEHENPKPIHFPYEINKRFLPRPTIDKSVTDIFSESVVNLTPSDNEKLYLGRQKTKEIKVKRKDLENPKKWNLSDEREVENDVIDDVIKFGTCDPDAPVSSTPCGGCGALLHCNNMSIPGFLPKEVFKGKTDKELQSEICQRCHYLKEFDVALGVNVPSSEYPNLMSQIRKKKSISIVLIDLLDFPCSIWPGIMDILGSKPFIIVGNKVDLFIQEEPGFLHHMKKCLLKSLEDQGINMENLLHVALISAKTGYGIEQLINKLHKLWENKGDVYLIGCTNAGKSTLFNALIQSDFCKVKATDLLHRATISAWPGTTLNLLKFPIMAPVGWKLYARTHRLIKQSKELSAYEKLKRTKQNIRLEQIPLSAQVVQTFKRGDNQTPDLFRIDSSSDDIGPKGLDPDEVAFALSRWCYDTPGVVHHDQIINLLTTSELLLTLPRSMVLPRNFYMQPGTSLFIGGLARLDCVRGSPVWFTVYASKELPVTITKLEDADIVYKGLLGSEVFRVPYGGEERLKKWPELASKKFEISGKIKNEAVADIVLSSAGWVSLTLPPAYRCEVEVWTPEGRGIHLRTIPIIKTGFLFRGSKIPGTPAFNVVVREVEADDIVLR